MIGMALDEINRLTAAFNDFRRPDAPRGLRAEASPSGVTLTWEPTFDNHHAESYTVYRSHDRDFSSRESLGRFFETTSYFDGAVAPGDSVFYAVVAHDQLDNESTPSAGVGTLVPTADVIMPFDDPAPWPLTYVSGTWVQIPGALAHGKTPDGTPYARAMHIGDEFDDFDLRVHLSSPGDYIYSAGLVFRADALGYGYAALFGGPGDDWLLFGRLTESGFEELARAHYPMPFLVPTQRTLRVVANGNDIRILAADTELIRVTDARHRSGHIGFLANRGHIEFRHARLDRMTADRP